MNHAPRPSFSHGDVVSAQWPPFLVIGTLATLLTERPVVPPPPEPAEHCLAAPAAAPQPQAFVVPPAAPEAPEAESDPAAVASSAEYLRRGKRFAERERWPEALVAYTWARDVDPRNAAAHLGRALVFVELGRLQEANRAATRALALSADRSEVLVLQGLLAQLKGHPADARARYEAALAAAPTGPWADELRVILNSGPGSSARVMRP